MPEFKIEDPQSLAVIKVFGIGGAGGAAINRMKSSGLAGVSYVAVNTDAQALAHSEADEKIHKEAVENLRKYPYWKRYYPWSWCWG